MLAASTFDITIGGLTLVLALIIAAVFLARHDRVTRVRFGIFLERERHRDENEPAEGWPDPAARTEILWPKQDPSDASTTIPRKED